NQQQVLRLVFISKIEVSSAALDVEALDAGVEVDEADRHACNADDGQTCLVALAFDQQPLLDVDIERIGKDVDAVETDFAGHANAVSRAFARLRPSRIDQAKFHGVPPRTAVCRLCSRDIAMS